MADKKSSQPTVFPLTPPLPNGIGSVYLLRSHRRTLSVEITRKCDILVRAPMRCPQKVIAAFLRSHVVWISTHLDRAKARAAAHPEPTELEKVQLISQAKAELPELTLRYAALMSVSPKQIKITNAKKRFGSCSSENSICYSWRVMTYPDRAIEYVVVHELAHIRYKNHGKAFYEFVESILPDWRERASLLKQ